MKQEHLVYEIDLDNLPKGVRLVEGLIVVGPEKPLTFEERIRKILSRLADSLENEK